MDELNDVIGQIKKSPHYRGQIHRGVLLEKRGANPHDLKGFVDARLKSAITEILKACDFPFLYSHQGALIERIFEGKSAGLFIPRGAGRRTSVVLASAAYAIVKGKTVLILCRDDESARNLAKHFPSPLSRIVNVNFLEHEHFSAQMTTDIIISTPERLGRFLLRNYDEIKDWLTTLGLVVLSDVTGFDSIQFMHSLAVANLLESLIKGNEKIAYLVTGEPINNAAQVLTAISKSDNNAVVLSDGREKNAVNLLYWIPPHVVEAASGKPKIERRGFYREIGCLLEILKDRKKVLVWHSYASISKDRIARLLKTYSSTADATIIDSLDGIETASKTVYDGLIMLGLPINMESTLDSLGHFLADGSPAVVVLPNDPATMHFIRSAGSTGAREYPEYIACGTTPYVEFVYYMLYLYLSGQNKIAKTDLANSLKSDADYASQRLLSDNILIDEDDFFGIDRAALIDRLEKRFQGTLREEAVRVEFDRGEIFLDSCYFPERYFPGSLRFFNETVHQLIKDDTGYAFRSFGDNAPVKRVSIVQYETSAKPVASSSQNGLSFQLLEGDLKAIWKGYKEYADFAGVPQKPLVTTVGEGMPFTRTTFLIKIEGGNVSHDLHHLMLIWLPRYFLNFSDYFGICSDGRCVMLFSFLSQKKEAYNFWGMISSIIRKVLADSLALMLDECPCWSGCPYCLEIADCHSESDSLDKPGTMRFAAGVLGRDEERRIILKLTGLPGEEAQSFYEEISRKVFSLFEKKLDLLIKSKVPVSAVKTGVLDSSTIGLFDGRLIQVIENLSEAAATETIAHEYAHNWAAENMVIDLDSFPPEYKRNKESSDFLKKIVIEGFAQWAAFKVMDFYGLEGNMADIHLRKYDEYGEGFQAFYWLEDHYGFQAVLDFVKTGNFSAGEGKAWGLNEILSASGRLALRDSS